ncbi:MAG: hypothetical protein R6X15_05280 [Pseudomonadota bacterium]
MATKKTITTETTAPTKQLAETAAASKAYTPEELFSIPADAPTTIDPDVMTVILSRADAVIALLLRDGEGNVEDGFGLQHEVIMEALDCVSGLIRQAQQMTNHTYGGAHHG